MTRKRRRLVAVLVGLGLLGLATALVLTALNSNGALEFFASPTELKTTNVPEGRLLRLGGLVAKGSVKQEGDGKTIEFRISDGANEVPVTYSGVIPDLFREGQGVVVTGTLRRDGVVRADTLLAKHDENYMPREVVDALKKSGHWQEGEGTVAR
jgi:cytochrome c-type biogenesis protein CcmE